MEWQDFQYNSLTFGEGVPLTIINNAGQAEVYGSEFDLDYALSNEFTFSFSGSYNDAETTDVIQLSAGDIPKGAAMPYTPEWQLSSTVRYSTQFGEYGAYAQGAVSYSDGFTTDLRPEFAQNTDSYSLVNLAIGITHNNWHVDLFLDNATDERAQLDNVSPQNPSGYYSASGTWFNTNQPRSISLRFGQKF
jgi:outer membrane receptor protein involved in Fe transport